MPSFLIRSAAFLFAFFITTTTSGSPGFSALQAASQQSSDVSQATAAVRPAQSDDLSADEIARVRSIVEGAPRLKALDGQRVEFIDVEKIRIKAPADAGEAGDLRELVRHRATYYRYGDNAAVYADVDPDSGAIVGVEEVENAPTALSAAELGRIRELALGDPTVRKILGRRLRNVEIEAMSLFTADPEDWIYHRRAASVFFKSEGRYLVGLDVVVNLSDGVVEARRRQAPRHEMEEPQ